MYYTVEFSFVKTDTDKLNKCIKDLAIPENELSWNPHITLAVFENIDVDSLIAIVKTFSQEMLPFQVQMASIGLFPQEPAVFLVPVVTKDLLALHERLHIALDADNLHSDALYRPNSWVPHCSIAVGGEVFFNNSNISNASSWSRSWENIVLIVLR